MSKKARPVLVVLFVLAICRHADAHDEAPCPPNAGRHPWTDECVCNKGFEYMDFADMDLDSSGGLNLTEYRTALRKIDFISEAALDSRFSTVDHNGDGAITLEEYKIFGYRDTLYLFHCILCPSNTYKDVESNDRCTACPFNHSWTRMGAVDLGECICDFGHNGHPPDCQPCPSGTFKPYPGPYNCELCEANYYGTGPAKHTNEEACVHCPPHSNSTPASPSIKECLCRAGYYKRAETSMNCTACEPGKYSDVINKIGGCEDCEEEEITVLPAQTACICRIGLFRSDFGCEECVAGKYKDEHGDAIELCLSCPLYSRSGFASTNRSNCICNRGYYAENYVNGNDCFRCPNGTIKPDNGPHACEECPRGRVPNPLRVECWCMEDTYSNFSSGQCDDCTLYENLPDGCPRWPPHFWTECVSDDITLPDGTVVPTDDGKCQPCSELRCPAGFYFEACGEFRDARCVRCSNDIPPHAHYATPGHPKDVADTCAWACNQGYELTQLHSGASSGEKMCSPCPKGFYKNRAVEECSPCPYLTTTVAEGSQYCTACPIGYYRHSLADSGHAICIQCLPHATTHGEIALSPLDCYCGPGFHGYSWECRACPRGRYKPSVSVMPDTQRRKMNASDLPPTDTCTPCPASSFSGVVGATSASACIQCPENSISEIGADECICMRGYYDTIAGKLADCRPCPTNTYNDDLGIVGKNGCRHCPNENSFSPPASENVSSCICNAGYQGNGISNVSCQACPADTYATLNDDVCLDCPHLTYSLPGSPSILACQCPEGWYGSVGRSEPCETCPELSSSAMGSNRFESDCFCNAGYAGVPGQTACTPCQEPHTYPWESSRYCSCNAGYYGSPRDGIACAPCPDHSESANAAHERGECSCGSGFFGNLSDPGQACSVCPSYSSSTSGSLLLSECTCNAGYTGDVGADVSCTMCSLNAFTWAPNRCSCNAGFFKNSTSLECEACPLNSFNSLHSQEGESACLACPRYSTSDVTASVTISDCKCNHGYYWNDTLRVCSACPQGTFGWPPVSSNGHNETVNHTRLSLEDTIYRRTEGMCRSCPTNTYTRDNASQSATSCIACPENALSPSPGVPCLCNAGFAAADELGTICTACAPGTFKRSRSSRIEPMAACQACPQNSSSHYGSSVCYCPANQYGSVGEHGILGGGQVNCTRCPSNSVSPANSTSFSACQCDAGFWGEPAQGCKPCSPNATSFVGHAVTALDCYCVPNFYRIPSSQNLTCSACPLSSSSPAGAGSLADCTCWQGMYGDPVNGVPCEACGPNANSSMGANKDRTACFCDAGFYGDATKAGSGCHKCPANSSTAVGASNNTSLSDCYCDAGYYGNPGAMSGGAKACTPCPADTFNNQTGSYLPTSCIPCEGNMTSAPASTHPSACTPKNMTT